MDEIVLVTGAAGFIGAHVTRELLARGRNVRATARNPDGAAFLRKLPIADGGSLEIVKMELLDAKSVLVAVSGCSDIIHCAAALYVGAVDPQRDVVDPSIIGTQNLVDAISTEGGVNRIVHTSSVAAIRSTTFVNGQVFTADDWGDDATLKTNAYGLAKAGAERIIREWWGAQDFDSRPRLVTMHPSVVIGPILAPRHLSGSMGYLDHLVKGKFPFVLKSHINMVDVRDVATAHVNGLELGESGKRFVLHAGGIWHKEMALILRKSHPKWKWAARQLPKIATYFVAIFHPQISLGWVKKNIGRTCNYDANNSDNVLGFAWKSLDESIIDGASSLIQ